MQSRYFDLTWNPLLLKFVGIKVSSGSSGFPKIVDIASEFHGLVRTK